MVNGSTLSSNSLTFDTNDLTNSVSGAISIADIDAVLLNDSNATPTGTLTAGSFSESGGTNATTTLNQPLYTTGAAGISITGDKTITANSTIDATAAATGTITLTADKNIKVNSGASIKTAGGDLTLKANTAGTTGGQFIGIFVNGATVESATGSVLLDGTGGDSGVDNHGVEIGNGGIVQTTGGSGTVTIDGAGGDSSNSTNYGVYITGSGAEVNSGGGNVSVTGTGGGNGSSLQDIGVFVEAGAAVTAGGNGTVTVIGAGAASTGNKNFGVLVSGSGSAVTSSGGNVAVTGTGGGSGASNSNYGVLVFSGATVTAGGSGTVTVKGFGGATTGGSDIGVFIYDAQVTASGGSPGLISITGQPGDGSPGIKLQNGGVISTPGDVSLTGTSSSIVEAGATSYVNAALLTVNSDGGATLNGPNTVSSFNAANTTSGAIELTNTSTTLDITGIAQSGTAAGSDVTINQTDNLSITGDITATANATGAVTLIVDGLTDIAAKVDAATVPSLTGGSLLVDYTAGASLPQGLSFSTSTSGATLTVSDAGGAGANNYALDATSIARDGASSITYSGTLANLVIDGSDGANTLSVDNGGGLISAAITFAGGLGFDSLNVSGDAGAGVTAVYSDTGSDATGYSGNITYTGSVTESIDFTGLSPVETLTPVTSLTINMAAGANVENIVTGPTSTGIDPFLGTTATTYQVNYGGAGEPLNWRNATAVTVNGSANHDTITENLPTQVDNGSPNELTTLNINAGDGFDEVDVLATPSGVTSNVDGEEGAPNYMVVGATLATFNTGVGTLANINGPVNLADTGGTGVSFVDDSGGVAADTVTVTSTTIEFAGRPTIGYDATAGSLRIALTAQADTANVQSTQNYTLLFGNDGSDTFNVSSTAPTTNGNGTLTGDLSGIQGELDIASGDGIDDTLNVSDYGGAAGQTYSVTDTGGGATQVSATGSANIVYNVGGGLQLEELQPRRQQRRRQHL